MDNALRFLITRFKAGDETIKDKLLALLLRNHEGEDELYAVAYQRYVRKARERPDHDEHTIFDSYDEPGWGVTFPYREGMDLKAAFLAYLRDLGSFLTEETYWVKVHGFAIVTKELLDILSENRSEIGNDSALDAWNNAYVGLCVGNAIKLIPVKEPVIDWY